MSPFPFGEREDGETCRYLLHIRKHMSTGIFPNK
jgi:hypothetical protein